MAYDFLLSSNTLANGRIAHYAKLAGSPEPRITIGFETKYQDNYGLFNISTGQNLTYDPALYAGGEAGFWAYFIYPTAMAESRGSFYCLNTYDRARFTFGFMQYAAHVPNGDFVKFFRKLLTLPEAANYFPRLSIREGRIWYTGDTGSGYPLEDDESTLNLMNYLNPSLSGVEHQEKICSARMVHWAMNDPRHRQLQVETAIEHFRSNMTDYDRRFTLDGASAKVCQLICDIRHQGRGSNDMIACAINTGGNWDKAYTNLGLIGYNSYKGRVDTVKNTISSLLNQGLFDTVYRRADNSFVPRA